MEKLDSIEVSAATVEEAVEKGLAELGVARDSVQVEVLDEGKRNIFRFASRQAKVRLTLINADLARDLPTLVNNKPQDSVLTPAKEETMPKTQAVDSSLDARQNLVAETTREILEKMGITAAVKTQLQTVEDSEVPVVYVNIEGSDLSFLIGRKSETLNALQHITGLIVSRRYGEWIPIQLDVQNYRTRRVVELQKLARRIAEQVSSTGRKQCLEPMPANERRIIHMELRDNTHVYSESTGEEPNRKVCVYPRN